MSTIKKQAIKGTIWSMVGYSSTQALRLGSNLILTRLLVPELFGLMALVGTFIGGLNLFSDIGIRPSIIRSSRWQDPRFLNTAWTLQAVRGVGIWILCCLISWPVANFYNDARLIWLLPIVGFTSVLGGFNSTSLATLERQLKIIQTSLLQTGTQIISIGVMIFWAYISQTIWALVGGVLIASVVKLIWSHKLNSPNRNCFTWDKKIVREILSFGKWIFISTAMTFLASQIDRLLLGKILSLELLGVYIIAFTLADIPRQIMLKVSSQIMLPVISHYADVDRAILRTMIVRKRRFLLVILGILVTFLACFGDLIIKVLYDHRYVQAAWMLPILAVGLWPMILSLTIDKVLFVIGVPRFVALGNVLKFIYMLIFIPLGFHYKGLLGVIIVISFNDIPFYVAVLYGLAIEKLSAFKQDILATLVLLFFITLVSFLRHHFGFGYSIDGVIQIN